MNWQERIIADPKVLAGKPVIKGTLLAVEFILDLLAGGWSEAEVLQNYPRLTHEDIQACFINNGKLSHSLFLVFGSCLLVFTPYRVPSLKFT